MHINFQERGKKILSFVIISILNQAPTKLQAIFETAGIFLCVIQWNICLKSADTVRMRSESMQSSSQT